jgi:ribonuclease P protein component
MKLESLRGKDLARVFKKGTEIQGRFFKLIYYRGERGLRLTVVVKKKIGKAVVRNKLKRRVKEVFRKSFLNGRRSFDIIVLLNEKSSEATFNELRDDILKCIERMK